MKISWWCIALGIVALLIVKYAVVGLDAWDATFHPGRVEPADSAWKKPLLGLIEAVSS